MGLFSRFFGQKEDAEEIMVPAAGLSRTQVEALLIDPEAILEIRIMLTEETDLGLLPPGFAGSLFGSLNDAMWHVLEEGGHSPSFKYCVAVGSDLDNSAASLAVDMVKADPEYGAVVQGIGRIGYEHSDPRLPTEAYIVTLYRRPRLGDEKKLIAVTTEPMMPSKGPGFEVRVDLD